MQNDEIYQSGDIRPSRLAASSFFLLMEIGLFALLILSAVFQLHGKLREWQTMFMNISMAYYALFVLLPILLYCRRRPGIETAMRIVPARSKHLALAALAAVVGLFLLNNIATLWMMGIQALGGKLSAPSPTIGEGYAALVVALIGMALTPAVCEELLFRGVMLGAYEENGTLRAGVWISLCFALSHASVEGFLAQFLVGLVLIYLAVNTGSVVVSMVYHFVHNALTVIVSYVTRARFDPNVDLYHELGGMAGLLMMLIQLAVGGLLFYVLMLGISSDREQEALPFGVERPALIDRGDWRDKLVMMAALVTAGAMMLVNLSYTIGVF